MDERDHLLELSVGERDHLCELGVGERDHFGELGVGERATCEKWTSVKEATWEN